MCCIFTYHKKKKIGFSHTMRSQDITAIHCSSSYSKSAIWADTDIRLIVKTTAQSVRNQFVGFRPYTLYLTLLITTIVVLNQFDQAIKSLLLGTK